MRIEDILGAIAAIQEYTRGMTFEAFSGDRKTIHAVNHNFVVIGEAAGNVPEAIVASHPEVPWDKMRAMRNIIVHAYFGVRKEIVWETIQTNLPPLVPLLRNLLGAET
jgi:uncharacterized protein with HEPN domain